MSLGKTNKKGVYLWHGQKKSHSILFLYSLNIFFLRDIYSCSRIKWKTPLWEIPFSPQRTSIWEFIIFSLIPPAIPKNVCVSWREGQQNDFVSCIYFLRVWSLIYITWSEIYFLINKNAFHHMLLHSCYISMFFPSIRGCDGIEVHDDAFGEETFAWDFGNWFNRV